MNKTLIPFVLLLAGCSMKNPINSIAPYKIDIYQGNQVTQEMISQLKPGMTPSQVRFVMGTPLVVDPFHPDRWDYVMQLEKGGKLMEKRRITAVFQDGRLKGIEGDVAPAGSTPPTAGKEAK